MPFAQADREAGRGPAALGLRARAPERLPGRRARERVPARVPARPGRRAPVRAGGRGHREAAEGPALQRGRRWATASARPASSPSTTASCAGRNGAARVEVDALGNLTDTLKRGQPLQGSQLRLSLDLDVQRVAQQALAGGTGRGAFAVMDVDNGEVLALGSQPSFDPNIFTKPLSQKRSTRSARRRSASRSSTARSRRGYPTGSTFKLVTATAALESGHITPETVAERPRLAHGRRRQSSRTPASVAHGALALRQALTVSSDVFFYQLGQYMNEKGMPLQKWGRQLGIGRRTGIDLPAEEPGRLPTPAVARPLVQAGPRPTGPGPSATTSTSRWARATCSPNPLQMAVAYAAIANGGRVLRPRLGLRIEDASGRAIQQLDAPDSPPLEDLAGEPRRDPRGPPRRRERPGRNLDAGLRGIPDPNCRKDRNRRARRQARPVMVRRAGSVPEPQVRRGGDRRGRRLRRRHRRADGAADPRRAARRARRPAWCRAAGRPTDAGLDRTPRQGLPRRGLALPAHRPADAGRHDRPDRGEHLHRRHGHPGRHQGRPELLRLPPGRLRGGGIRPDAADHALRLLAPEGVEARHLRVHDRLDPARVRARLLGPRLAPRDRVPVLQLPGLGARQAAADRGARRASRSTASDG